jgi:hypothetical protein
MNLGLLNLQSEAIEWDAKHGIIEASTLGLPPAVWPEDLIVRDSEGIRRRFLRAVVNNEALVTYKSQEHTLTVLND